MISEHKNAVMSGMGSSPLRKVRLEGTASRIRVELGLRGKKPQLPPLPDWLAHFSAGAASTVGG